MSQSLKAIETSGVLDKKGRIVLDEPLKMKVKSKVRVIILFDDEADISDKDWLKAANANPAFDFLKEPHEDIYTPKDGKPFNAKR